MPDAASEPAATPAGASPRRWRLLLRLPFTLTVVAAMLVLGVVTGALWTPFEDHPWFENVAFGAPAFAAGHWWTPVTGSFFALDGAPGWLQAISRLLPLRHLNDGMMDVMVRGMGIAAIWQPLLILLAFAAACSFVAARLFRWDA